MRPLLTIAGVTFRETVRQPACWLLFIAGAIMLLVLPFVALFAAGQERVFLVQLGVATVSLTAVLLALVAAANVVTREIESKTVLTLLAKPVSRATVIVGKYLGIAIVQVLLHVALYLVLAVAMGIQISRDIHAPDYGEWLSRSVDEVINEFAAPLAAGTYASLLQSLLVTSVLVLGSTLLAVVPNALVTFGFITVGNLRDLIDTSLKGDQSFGGAALAGIAGLLIPNLRAYDLFSDGLTTTAPGDLGIPPTYLLELTAQCGLYSAMMLAIAVYVFSSREFT